MKMKISNSTKRYCSKNWATPILQPKEHFVNFVQKRLRKWGGIELRRYNRNEPRLWSHDTVFIRQFEEIRNKTVVGEERCFMLYQWAHEAAHLPGDIAELGVYRGGTARLLAQTCPQKTLLLYDTFEGMPDTTPDIDKHNPGDFADTSLEDVSAFLADQRNVMFRPGLFPESAILDKERTFCLAYVDVDIYESVRAALAFFYPRMTAGGIMVFDDYRSPNCPGVEKAINEFLVDKNKSAIITTRSQCLLIT